MRRASEKGIWDSLGEKIVLLTGPRQVGKTTLAKGLSATSLYLNYDDGDDRQTMRERAWDRATDLIIFDEVHKMKSWKSWLKGIYDKDGVRPRLLVTGSARLDVSRRMGDSLAGRFFAHRLHPLDSKELAGTESPDAVVDRLLRFGGFPEPYLKGADAFYGKWRRSHVDVILRQDLLDLEAPRHIHSIELLVDLLRRRVGSTISYASLARDLQHDPKTIRHWLEILENLHVIFRIAPSHRNVARALLKEPKYYFYDVASVIGDAARIENLVASSLRKELDRVEDEEGKSTNLSFLRTKDGREIDFIAEVAGERTFIEVKSSDSVPSPHFQYFQKFLKPKRMLQVVHRLPRDKQYPNGVEVRSMAKWLTRLDL